MSTFQITRKMASVMKESSSDVFVKLSDQLGGLVLKEEQKLAVEALLSGRDVIAVLSTGFGKSIVYQSEKHMPTPLRSWLLFSFTVLSKTSCSQMTLI